MTKTDKTGAGEVLRVMAPTNRAVRPRRAANNRVLRRAGLIKEPGIDTRIELQRGLQTRYSGSRDQVTATTAHAVRQARLWVL